MIIKVPDKRLLLLCDGVKFDQAKHISNKLREEWDLFQKRHKDFTVVGLAAPQIGITKNIFIAFGEVFINPEILGMIEETTNFKEGCCSLPDDQLYKVERHLEVKLKWINRQRQFKIHTFYDDWAAVVQHEMDHLRGIMINEIGVKYDLSAV